MFVVFVMFDIAAAFAFVNLGQAQIEFIDVGVLTIGVALMPVKQGDLLPYVFAEHGSKRG